MNDRRAMVFTMVSAAIQADAKELSDLSPDEINAYIDRAVSDLKLAEDIIAARSSRATD